MWWGGIIFLVCQGWCLLQSPAQTPKHVATATYKMNCAIIESFCFVGWQEWRVENAVWNSCGLHVRKHNTCFPALCPAVGYHTILCWVLTTLVSVHDSVLLPRNSCVAHSQCCCVAYYQVVQGNHTCSANNQILLFQSPCTGTRQCGQVISTSSVQIFIS